MKHGSFILQIYQDNQNFIKIKKINISIVLLNLFSFGILFRYKFFAFFP